jgi:hypothetical protein
MKKTIELIQTRRGCACCETTDRYDVILNGVLFDQLWFNTRGYVGYLPHPDGWKLSIGEKSISAYKKEVASLNREWAAKKRSCKDQ